MLKKTIALAIIAVFAFSILSMTLAAQTQTDPVKVKQGKKALNNNQIETLLIGDLKSSKARSVRKEFYTMCR